MAKKPPFVQVINHATHVVEFPLAATSLRIRPGAQTVKRSDVEIVRRSPAAKRLFEATCVVKEIEPATEEVYTPGMQLGRLTQAAALKVIASCNDKTQLRAWAYGDPREETFKALHMRWRELCPEVSGLS